MAVDESLRRRLGELVAFDTQNPSGDEAPMVGKLARDLAALGATAVDAFTVGRHHAVYAAFGAAPTLLLNAHVDTVPANHGYSASPFALVERGGRLYGLGAADTKGAIAAILDALAERAAGDRPIRGVGVLFSGDEELGNTVAHAFVNGPHARGLERAIVCEPTGCRIGLRHRGIVAARAVATSPGGHSSRADAMPAPVVVLARVAVAIDAWAHASRTAGPAGFEGLCVNVASIDSGAAFNVVPSRAVLTVSFRPWPGADVAALHHAIEHAARAAAAPDAIEWAVTIDNRPFATRDLGAFAALRAGGARATTDLQFWTEAAVFSAAGIDAVVFGPGDIARAHAPDEYVEVSQLSAARTAFLDVLP